ncbi:MAG TPA: hypothetical protein VJ327_03845 [Patescibacteria group bacterium]|nr:hypothetical protein [Patescibacteria group bacterium]
MPVLPVGIVAIIEHVVEAQLLTLRLAVALTLSPIESAKAKLGRNIEKKKNRIHKRYSVTNPGSKYRNNDFFF